MLETLFVQEAQTQTFLWLTTGGFFLGAVIHLVQLTANKRRWLGWAGDVLASALLFAVLFGTVVQNVGRLRVYALLGIAVGMLLYCVGISRAVEWTGARVMRAVKKYCRSQRRKEGFSEPDGEMFTTNDAGGKE